MRLALQADPRTTRLADCWLNGRVADDEADALTAPTGAQEPFGGEQVLITYGPRLTALLPFAFTSPVNCPGLVGGAHPTADGGGRGDFDRLGGRSKAPYQPQLSTAGCGRPPVSFRTTRAALRIECFLPSKGTIAHLARGVDETTDESRDCL